MILIPAIWSHLVLLCYKWLINDKWNHDISIVTLLLAQYCLLNTYNHAYVYKYINIEFNTTFWMSF